MKTCRKCGECKPLEEFHRDSRARDGACYHCKVCAIARSRAHYQSHKPPPKARKPAKAGDDPTLVKNQPEIMRRYRSAWVERNRELLKEIRDRCRNTPEHRKYQREYMAKKRDELHSSAVKALITRSTGIPAHHIPEQVVDAKRAQIRVLRLLKEMKK